MFTSKSKKKTTEPVDARVRPGFRGWPGPGRGAATWLQVPGEFRGTTVQVCGLWPFAVGAGTPMVGVPLGRHIYTRATLCCDPISWFQRAKLISNPSMFLLGKPGLGKSTLNLRMSAGLAAYGVHTLVLGDVKPDYVEQVRALGGQVISPIEGLNVLDSGEATAAVTRLRASGHMREANEVLEDAHRRRHTIVAALVTILRGSPPSDREEAILDRALRVLDERHEGIPVLRDLLEVIKEAPDEVRAVALDRNSLDRYKEITEDLEVSLTSLTSGGRFGKMFAAQTAVPMRRDCSVVYDISRIGQGDDDLLAAALMACWGAGFGAVNVSNALADAGLEPRQHYFLILDELWRALRAGRGMVDRIDALTRLNRQWGVGMSMTTHTMSDLAALPEEDRLKAKGFVERSGMVIMGGLPQAEMRELEGAVALSRAEQEMLIGWTDPPAWDSRAGRETAPPGRGFFLVKVGGRPGIPVHVQLTATELNIANSNRLWQEAAAKEVTS